LASIKDQNRDDANTKIVVRIQRCVQKPCLHTAPQNFLKNAAMVLVFGLAYFMNNC